MKFIKKDTKLLLRFDDEHSNYSVVFDDDDRVAYAYLLKDEEIISDVWLYNVCATPKNPEWNDLRKKPFANSVEYVSESMVERARNDDDVIVEWQHQDSQLVGCGIYLRGELLGTLNVGHNPGYAAMAVKDGPLAYSLY